MCRQPPSQAASQRGGPGADEAHLPPKAPTLERSNEAREKSPTTLEEAVQPRWVEVPQWAGGAEKYQGTAKEGGPWGTGGSYYWNRATGGVTWERPAIVLGRWDSFRKTVTPIEDPSAVIKTEVKAVVRKGAKAMRAETMPPRAPAPPAYHTHVRDLEQQAKENRQEEEE